MATKRKVNRTHATWNEKYEKLYHFYRRSIVTFKELKEFGQKTYGTTMAVTKLRRIPECRTIKKGVYRLDYVLDVHGIARIAEYEKSADTFARNSNVKAAEDYETVTEGELDWILTQQPARIEPGLKAQSEELRKIRGIGEMDHLFRDSSGRYVVVEVKRFKRDRNNREAVGQTVLYMGWVTKHLAKTGDGVRGILIVGKNIGRIDPVLEYAPEAIPGFEVRYWDSVIVPDSEQTSD